MAVNPLSILTGYRKYFVLTILAYASLTLGVLLVLLFTGLAVNSTWGISVGLVL